MLRPLWRGKEVTIKSTHSFLLDVAEVLVMFAAVTARFLLQSTPALVFALSYGVALICLKLALCGFTIQTSSVDGIFVVP